VTTAARVWKARTRAAERLTEVKQRVYRIQEGDQSRLGRVLGFVLLNLILLNLVAVILETVPELADRYGVAFDVFEAVSVAIFSVEYLLRLWSCTSNPKYRHPVFGRIRFALTPMALIDLIAIAPAYVPGDVFLDLRYVRVVRLVRLLRVLKMARYSQTLRTFSNVVGARVWDLGLIGFFLVILLIVASITMYFAEHEAQPEMFSSIPAAMWWGVVTLTTVGYGDIYPVTPLGKLFGSVIALVGIGFFALPAGLLAAGFAEEIRRERDAKKKCCPHCGKELS
jgi:voltage-gated potassium channel